MRSALHKLSKDNLFTFTCDKRWRNCSLANIKGRRKLCSPCLQLLGSALPEQVDKSASLFLTATATFHMWCTSHWSTPKHPAAFAELCLCQCCTSQCVPACGNTPALQNPLGNVSCVLGNSANSWYSSKQRVWSCLCSFQLLHLFGITFQMAQENSALSHQLPVQLHLGKLKISIVTMLYLWTDIYFPLFHHRNR